MTIYMLPEFDMNISSCGYSKKLASGNIYYFTYTSECVFDVCAVDFCDSFNYSFSIKNQTVEGGNCKTIKLGQDEILIQLLPVEYFNINSINSNIYMYDNSPCIVNIFDNKNATVLIQYQDKKIYKKLIKNNYKINIFEKKIKNNSILFIALENSIKKYFLILNKNKILFNNYVKEININDNLIILDDNANCLGENTVFEYNFEKNSTTKYAVEYKRKNIIDCLEIKFLDAVKVCNCKLMKECLSADFEQVELSSMQEFLGEYERYLNINNHYLLIKDNEVFKSINFEIKDNLITNIYE